MKCLVFAPGIMGSTLRNNDGLVWPPKVGEVIFGYHRVDELLGDDVQPVDPVYRVGPMGIYRTLLEDIRACGYSDESEDKRFIAYPYDWRRSNELAAQHLAELFDSKFANIPPGLQITLLGHSMGGLVMRYLLESGQYTDRPWFSSIDRLITMGTPHYGASVALFRLEGTEKSVGLSGPDIKRMANDSRYPSTFELVPPVFSALTTEHPLPGELPSVIDPFDNAIARRLDMNQANIDQARSFWSGLDLANRPPNIEYFFVVGSAMKTNVRNEWINAAQDPVPIKRKASGDGTVPIASACIVGIPHIFSQKKHSTIFADRSVRRFLYRVLDAPADVRPQSAGDGPEVGDIDAVGISVNQEAYDPGEEIEVVISFNQDMVNPEETFELAVIDPDTGERKLDEETRYMSVQLQGVSVSVFSFSIADDLPPGLYELRSGTHGMDDPEPTTFYIRDVSNEH